MSETIACSSCGAGLRSIVVDLGMSPLSNALVDASAQTDTDALYPLRAYVCESCWLVQVPPVASRERIFGDYAYFSSYSDTWLTHARTFAARATDELKLGPSQLVVELASNDGYLLREFALRSVPVLGVEPAANVADTAIAAGIPTVVEFFGVDVARRLVSQGRAADLIVGNNVLAHVPDVNDFIAGVAMLLKQDGTATFEFPHLLRMLEAAEFDTIYHEHFSYFSLRAAQRIFDRHGLQVIDVDELSTHGGSLRLWVRQAKTAPPPSANVAAVLADESLARLERVETYGKLREAADRIKRDLLAFLHKARDDGKRVAGYGAPAKATTLLNYCGVGTDLLEYTVDRSPHKQGRFIPGVRVPIDSPRRIFESRPDFVLVLPWNIKDEVVDQMSAIGDWGARFVLASPRVTIIESAAKNG